MATIPAHENEFPEVLFTEGAAPAAPGTGLVKAYAKSDGLLYSKDDAGAETALGAAAHIADTGDAHDASAISIADAGALYTATDVEAALAEVMGAVAGGGIPATIVDAAGDLIVGTAADTVARLALGATNGMAVRRVSGALAWAFPPGHVLDYVEFTSNVTINQSAIASAVTVVSAGAISFDGSTTVRIEFHCPGTSLQATSGVNVQYFLFDGSTSLGCIAYHRNNANVAAIAPSNGAYRLTPSNASHTYSIRATSSSGTSVANAASGGATLTDFLPGYIRISIAG